MGLPYKFSSTHPFLKARSGPKKLSLIGLRVCSLKGPFNREGVGPLRVSCHKNCCRSIEVHEVYLPGLKSCGPGHIKKHTPTNLGWGRFLASSLPSESGRSQAGVSLHLWRVEITAIGLTLPFAIITVFLLSLVLRARANKVVTGTAGLVDSIAVAYTALKPGGKVFVHGEFWDAVASQPMEAGARVRIAAVEGLVLKVEPE